MEKMARNATDESWGFPGQPRFALHDRDTKFCASFQATLAAGGIKPIQLPARSPTLKAYASYCSSCEPWKIFSRKRRPLASFTP